jgi:hypothetical protein
MTKKIMTKSTALLIAVALAGTAAAQPAAAPDDKGKVCRMEKQCRWENFKKICITVKVCR